NRSVSYPVSIVEDVFLPVGKFTFPADFVVVDYDVDPRVPLILGRLFLRTARAIVDVYGEELILRDGDEKLISHADSTSKYPYKHGNDGSTTSPSDSFPSLISSKTSDSSLEEFVDELALLEPFPPRNTDIDIIDPILERFTDEPALVYSFPLGDDDDDLFDFKSDDEKWKKFFDSTLHEESSEIATLLSSPFRNEDKVFNPGILILEGTQIFHDE
ncbi:reverse transcriptase domain-containing protein, partial [Tanacetum coccineum]